jgi:FGGY-family pentulose kinase
MNEPCVIGVDGGTESLRVGVFDLEGHPMAFASTAYETRFPHPGWAEQDPRDWWQALGQSVRRAVEQAGVDSRQIAAMAVDTTCCSVVALDGSGEPLRPCLIWMDLRSAPQTEKVVATGDVALRVNSDGRGPVSAEWMVPKALWIKQNEPEIFERAAVVCEYQDYVNYLLTGRWVASITNVSARWHYNRARGGVPETLLEGLGLSDLAAKWPAEVVDLGQVVGGLTARAAEHLALPKGLPVVQGGADAFVGMVGLGVVRPGSLAFITGSSHLQLGISAVPFHGTGIWGTYSDALLPGLHVVEGGQTSTGSVVNWLKNLFGHSDYEDLNRSAAELPPGSEGVIVQEHFQGNRTPHTDPGSRGAIHGLSLKHGRGHLFRATIEGIAFGSELILETMRTNGFEPERIVVAGGATRSDLWLQIHADVSNLPLTLTEVADAPLLGCAVLASVGAGLHEDILTASDRMVKVARVIGPDDATHSIYRPFYEAYKATYGAVRSVRQHLEAQQRNPLPRC